MSVRLLSEAQKQAQRESDFVRVRTQADPNDATITLATIERVVEKTRVRKVNEPAWHVRTLVLETPMSPDTAVGLATRYAERKNIPVVVTSEG